LSNTRTVSLATGGSITLSGDFNIFDLAEPERALLSYLQDALDEYEARNETSVGIPSAAGVRGE